MCDADAVILLRISVVAWPPNTGGERHTETREARHVWLHSETLLLDCRPIVSPASRPSRRRQINPPEIADSQHGSPAEAKVPGEACREALGNELKHQRTTTQPASIALANIHFSSCFSSSINPFTHYTQLQHHHQQQQQHQFILEVSSIFFVNNPAVIISFTTSRFILRARRLSRILPTHTHACLPCQKVAAARQGRQHRPRTLTLENTSISTHATNLRGPCLPPTCHQRRAK